MIGKRFVLKSSKLLGRQISVMKWTPNISKNRASSGYTWWNIINCINWMQIYFGKLYQQGNKKYESLKIHNSVVTISGWFSFEITDFSCRNWFLKWERRRNRKNTYNFLIKATFGVPQKYYFKCYFHILNVTDVHLAKTLRRRECIQSVSVSALYPLRYKAHLLEIVKWTLN